MKEGGVELIGTAGPGSASKSVVSTGVPLLDFFLRIIAIVCTLGSAIAMATTNETLPFFTRFIRFRAKFNHLPMFTFFVVANSIVSVYLLLSLALSIFHIIRKAAKASRIVLIFFDTAMLALLMAGAFAATAIVYLAHKGNRRTNWFAIWRQFNSFCGRISSSYWFLSRNSLLIIVDSAIRYEPSLLVDHISIKYAV